jgi:hypothetical protein
MAEFDGVAEGVVKHRPLAPLRQPGGRLPRQGPGAGHPAQNGGGLARRDPARGFAPPGSTGGSCCAASCRHAAMSPRSPATLARCGA